MWAALIPLLDKAFGLLQMLLKALGKTPSEAIEKKRQELREEMDRLRKTGRPSW
jgi:hypothetical protein